MSLHAIDAKNTKKHTTPKKRQMFAHTITATLAGLNNPTLIYNYVAESPTNLAKSLTFCHVAMSEYNLAKRSSSHRTIDLNRLHEIQSYTRARQANSRRRHAVPSTNLWGIQQHNCILI